MALFIIDALFPLSYDGNNENNLHNTPICQMCTFSYLDEDKVSRRKRETLIKKSTSTMTALQKADEELQTMRIHSHHTMKVVNTRTEG
jgi:hypothetical protein